jgi:prepilin peptidase CpaA
MTLHPQAIVLAAFVAVMAVAAFEDFRRLVIPNLLPIILCALWPFYFYFAAAPTPYGALIAIGCAAAVFLGGTVLFAFGQLGGGDVKLLGAVTLWAGDPIGTFRLLMLVAIMGGVLALLLLMPFARQIVTASRIMLGQPPIDVGQGMKMQIPYGLAIIGAALVVTLNPYFG